MNIKTFYFFIVCVLLMGSCKSAKKTAQSDSPYLTEETSGTEVAVNSGSITVLTESVKPVDQSDNTMYKFYVIVGSFRNITGARQEKAGLERKGFTPVILENENGLYRISAGGYNEENAARARIAGIRAAYREHGDVWLLVRK